MADGKIVIDVTVNDKEVKSAEKSIDSLSSKYDGAFQDKMVGGELQTGAS